jgi:outer membrane biosynthesis protein TonB
MAKTKKEKEEVVLDKIVDDTKKENKPQKIDEQELAQLQSSVKTIDQLTHEVGTIEVRKHALMKAMEQVQTRIEQTRVHLNTKYGTDNISIQDGVINYPQENGEADKKD